MSVSSSIDSRIQNSTETYGPVNILDRKITVYDEGGSETSGEDNYIRAWIGGAGVSEVTVEGTTLLSGNASSQYGA